MPTEGRDTSLTAPSGMTLDSTAPPPGYPSDTLYTHLHGLCIYDFRVESWYLDSLFLVMFFVIGLACIILPMVELGHVTAILQFFAFGGVLPFIILFFICVTAIPLCGVASIIRQGGTSHRRPSFILRLAIDPGVGYRVSRGLFFVYAPISSALFGGMSSRLFDFAAIVPGVWCLICAAIFCYASLSCLLSVYLEVFSGKA